jgi:Protein of unknown function (DUF3800)
MAYFLFIDESGQDHRASPYEVLAGVAVADRDLWNLIRAVQDAEAHIFGRRYSLGQSELKGKKLLSKKVFRKAAQLPLMKDEDRRVLAQRCLESGSTAGKYEITALAQAKLAYVREVFEICSSFRTKAFASIVTKDAPVPPSSDHLRKDYAYLFERFFYYLEDFAPTESGVVVFDELERSSSHILVEQMDRYFKRTTKGKQMSGQIIPEPFFVHSDLTTGIQIADLVAYTISWGFRRITGMNEPTRTELEDIVERICRLRHRTFREVGTIKDFEIWSFCLLTDLRTKDMQSVE